MIKSGAPFQKEFASLFLPSLYWISLFCETLRDERFAGLVEAEIGRNDGLISSLRAKTKACKDEKKKSGMDDEIKDRIRLNGALEGIVKTVGHGIEFREQTVKMMGMIPLRTANRVAAKGGREKKGHQ